jgi:uncharacterized membrane protein
MEEIKLERREIEEGAGVAALSYVFFLWILVFRFQKENRFARSHAKQGIVVFMGEMIFAVLSLLPYVGRLFYISGLLIFLFISMRGIYYALTGRSLYIPLVSEIAAKFVI